MTDYTNHRFRAVLFDLDGTMLDTLADLANAMNWALAKLACPEHPLPAYRYMVGSGRRALVQAALPSDRQELLEQAENLMTEYYTEHCFDNSRHYNGIPELLRQLSARDIPLAILSNKPDNFTKLTVEKLLVDFRFAIVQGETDALPRKPNPAAALHIAKLLKLSPDDLLYLGDTSIDMQTAVSAGMYPVGVTWGFREADELLQAGAKTLIDHPQQLMQFFD